MQGCRATEGNVFYSCFLLLKHVKKEYKQHLRCREGDLRVLIANVFYESYSFIKNQNIDSFFLSWSRSLSLSCTISRITDLQGNRQIISVLKNQIEVFLTQTFYFRLSKRGRPLYLLTTWGSQYVVKGWLYYDAGLHNWKIKTLRTQWNKECI